MNLTSTPRPSSELTIPPKIHATELAKASAEELLIYALTLDDDDPVLGALLGTSRDIGMLAALTERTTATAAAIDLGDFAIVLEQIQRRLDVAIELLKRRSSPNEGASAEGAPECTNGTNGTGHS